ncbi:facilitated trehalose transporter Tret1 [Anabrus simplex]|uniref:facilitated trehalose transporter Tret1 n=1 Tax=Anabrus simplex TaxID=316456 RepID=UPI0035A2EE13
MQKLDNVSAVNINLKRRLRWQQYVAASLATLGALCNGAVLGWTAPVLPYLEHHTFEPGHDNFTTDVPVTEDEASWIGALAPFGALLGALPAGHLADAWGRKTMLLILAVLFLVGWLIIAAAQQSVMLLYISRLLSGLACGAVTVIIPLYNEEIAEDDIRGALGTYLDLMLAVGILWSYVIGAFVSYVWFSVISCLLPIFFFLAFVWMPESPVYLLAKGEITKAEKSLLWLRGAASYKQYDLEAEIHEIQKLLSDSSSNVPGVKKSITTLTKEFLASLTPGTPTSKACIAVFGLMMFMQLSGIDAILFYTVDIFQEAGSSLSPVLSTVIAGIIQVVATYASSLLVDRFGRKPLLMVSCAVMAASHAMLAVHLTVREYGIDVSDFGWIPVLSVNLFLIAFAIGVGPIPWFMMAELLPLEAKRWGSGVAVCLNWTLSFVVTKWFDTLLDCMGSTFTYTLFSVICFIMVLFVGFLVPETKGKSREEIQQELGATILPVY